MTWFEIEGGGALSGKIVVQGSKNAALPIMAAAILNKKTTVLHNVPRIDDVENMKQILEYLGCKIRFEGNVMEINAADMNRFDLPLKETQKMRSSIMLLGPMLARFQRVKTHPPGGCLIGKRPIDIHMDGLSKMGAQITENEDFIEAQAERLHGCSIILRFPSVGATENLIMAAVGAKGETILYNYAREPEILELCQFLQLLGVKISGFGTNGLHILGGIKSQNVEYGICGDRIAAGTYLCACLLCGGQIFLQGVPHGYMTFIYQLLEGLGAYVWREDGGVGICGKRPYPAIPYLKTGPYPGFSTDLQSQVLSLLSVAQGDSILEETVFEDRFHVVKELQKMGAEIIIEGSQVRVHGVPALHGADVEAKDLRGGAALVMAGLAAKGITRIYGESHIRRGYEHLDADFQALGGRVFRME